MLESLVLPSRRLILQSSLSAVSRLKTVYGSSLSVVVRIPAAGTFYMNIYGRYVSQQKQREELKRRVEREEKYTSSSRFINPRHRVICRDLQAALIL